MTELVDLLAADMELLPCQAAEHISLQRLAEKESKRTAKDMMEPMPTHRHHAGLQDAAELIVETQSSIIAVLSTDGKLAGVLTTWDITRAVAEGVCDQKCGNDYDPESHRGKSYLQYSGHCDRSRAKPDFGNAGGG